MEAAVLQVFLSEEAQQAGLKFQPPRELDAGFDLPTRVPVQIAPESFEAIPTGVHLAIPAGWVGLLRDRSSVALRGGSLTGGVIDASYRGEIKVILHNRSRIALTFDVGERIAQCVVVPHLAGSRCEVVSSLNQLGETDRGAAGFGSTGR